ncbi:MAG TPA: hypothetical protein VEP90_30355 [Methylomirabilota bacterium]|nr:hypothetical protein [Methylomirabilota bacterium]
MEQSEIACIERDDLSTALCNNCYEGMRTEHNMIEEDPGDQ